MAPKMVKMQILHFFKEKKREGKIYWIIFSLPFCCHCGQKWYNAYFIQCGLIVRWKAKTPPSIFVCSNSNWIKNYSIALWRENILAFFSNHSYQRTFPSLEAVHHHRTKSFLRSGKMAGISKGFELPTFARSRPQNHHLSQHEMPPQPWSNRIEQVDLK